MKGKQLRELEVTLEDVYEDKMTDEAKNEVK